MIFAKTWSKIENLTIASVSNAIFSNNVCNLGIHEYRGELYTAGYVGITRLVDRFGRVLKDNNDDDIVICVTQDYNVDSFDMLSAVMSDDEYFIYCESLERDKKELFTIFDNQPLIETITNGTSGELLICATFIKHCSNVCKKQLKSQMLTNRENMYSKVKGKIDLKNHIKYNVFKGREDRIYCKYSRFTYDIIENQILKCALVKAESIIRKSYPRAYEILKRDINYCKNNFRYISEKQIVLSDFSRVKVNGMYSFYKPAIKSAKILLKDGGLELAFGDNGHINYIVPYAINMEALFEFFIRSKMKSFYKDDESISIVKYNKKYRFLTDENVNTHLMKNYIPDVVIKKDGNIVMVLDVKYKRRLQRDRYDSHQIMSYALLTNVAKCGFVFPNESGNAGLRYSGEVNIMNSDRRVMYYEYETSIGDEFILQLHDLLEWEI